jgi:hypothetical protein
MDYRTRTRVAQLMNSPPMERTDVKLPESRIQALRPVFLMRNIPSTEAAPTVRSKMLDLLGIREQYQEDGEEALHDGDEFREEAAQRYYDEYKERLHDEYAVYVDGLGANAEGSKVLDTDISKTPEASPHFVGIEFPLPVVHAHSREQIRENLDLPCHHVRLQWFLVCRLDSPHLYVQPPNYRFKFGLVSWKRMNL